MVIATLLLVTCVSLMGALQPIALASSLIVDSDAGASKLVDAVQSGSSLKPNLEICAAPPTSGAGVTSIFEPNSPPAREIRDLSYLVLGICLAIFIVVQGFLVLAIVRGVKAARTAKDNPTTTSSEPQQVYGSVPIEIAWTVIPVIVVFVLAMVTIRTIRDIDATTPPEGALAVTVIGHQWWWEYRYTVDSGSALAEQTTVVVTANELHVPVGRPVSLRLESADVIHSFWVPRLAGKTDLIPGHTNHLWFNAEQAGLYLGQCAEYCGRAIFSEYACLNCHTIAGTSAGMFGPNLTHLASRDTIGSGTVALTRASLRQWIDDPDVIKPSCNMPSLKLSADELDAITDYLMTLK